MSGLRSEELEQMSVARVPARQPGEGHRSQTGPSAAPLLWLWPTVSATLGQAGSTPAEPALERKVGARVC